MRGIGLLLIFLVVFAVLWSADHFYFSTLKFSEDEVLSLDQRQQKELDSFVDVRRRFIDVAIGLIAGISAFVLTRYGIELPVSDIRTLTAGLAFSGLSIYFGFQAWDGIRWMLHNNFFNLSNVHVAWPERAQFWSLTFSVICVAVFLYRALKPRRSQ